MTPAPPAPLPAPAPASKNRGCFIALAVVAGLALLTCLVGGVAAWRFSKDPEVQKAFKALGAGAKLAVEGNKALGTEQLRAAGCSEALVIDGREMSNLVGQFVDAGLNAEVDPGLMVICQGNEGTTPPSCGEVARVYVSAATPTRPFTASVTTTDTARQCSVDYDATGTPLVEDGPSEPAGDEEDPDEFNDPDEPDDEAPPEPNK